MSALITNKVQLGQSGTANNNIVLQSDGAGNLEVRKGNQSAPGALIAKLTSPSSVRVVGPTVNGSTNTMIRRFTTVVDNIGSDITYADSATAGATFTAVTDGMYAISWTDSFNAAGYIGLSKNSSQLTTSVVSITASTRLAISTAPTADQPMAASTVVYLAAGDVVRPHGNGAASGSISFGVFTMSKVG